MFSCQNEWQQVSITYNKNHFLKKTKAYLKIDQAKITRITSLKEKLK